jgi:hypothetical protein
VGGKDGCAFECAAEHPGAALARDLVRSASKTGQRVVSVATAWQVDDCCAADRGQARSYAFGRI